MAGDLMTPPTSFESSSHAAHLLAGLRQRYEAAGDPEGYDRLVRAIERGHEWIVMGKQTRIVLGRLKRFSRLERARRTFERLNAALGFPYQVSETPLAFIMKNWLAYHRFPYAMKGDPTFRFAVGGLDGELSTVIGSKRERACIISRLLEDFYGIEVGPDRVREVLRKRGGGNRNQKSDILPQHD
jgi:hypothetical protein